MIRPRNVHDPTHVDAFHVAELRPLRLVEFSRSLRRKWHPKTG